MNIVVGSAFRNSLHYLDRYFSQVAALQQYVGPCHCVRVIAVEGDSIDGTVADLACRSEVTLVRIHHGGPVYGSTEQPERFVALSRIGNAIFEAVRETDDVLVYVESDLIWDAPSISSLIDMAMRRESGFDIFAPLIMAGPHFYDIWGFRKDGTRFSPFRPFHPDVNGNLTPIDSAGSCLVMRREVAMRCRIRNDYCLVGWCADAQSKGYSLALCPQFKVDHP